MDRRRFLHALGLSAGSLALAPSLPALALAGDEAYGRFAAARAARPWLAGWDDLTADLPPAVVRLEGRLPPGLRGTLFRNGPARFTRAGVRYRHWFDGDGLVQAWRLTDRGVTHAARFVRTHKYEREAAAGRFLVDGAGTRIEGAAAIRNADDMNTANTSVLAHAGKLYALWEGGSAFELDPATLATRGPRTWRGDLAALPFSAHPLRDADGSVWNIGQLPFLDGGTLLLWRVAPDGSLASLTPLATQHAGYAHSFVLGARYLAVVLAPWMLEPQDDRAYFESLQWRPERGALALLIDKHDPTRVRRYALPAGLAYHWADGGERGDAFELHGCWYDDARRIEAAMGARMRGATDAEPVHSRWLRLGLPLSGGTARWEEAGPRGLDFPDFRRGEAGARRHVFALQEHGRTRAGYLNAVVSMDRVRQREQRYVYGSDVLAEEHRFVPRPGARRADDGWLVGTALDAGRGEHLFSVFEARDVAAGPVCQARLPRMLPLSFHAEFAPG